MTEIDRAEADILILGTGGAGLFAALHAHRVNPNLNIAIAAKGLLGKCGCTRMVQGGYNVALQAGDSIERHFMDTIKGGAWIPDQELAWKLVTLAPERVLELENRIGCFFDRNPDGTLHGKAFAGQTFDRTIHKGDLTGIEIINRLMEQVWARPIQRLEEHRAVAFIKTKEGDRLAGVLMIDMRTGDFRLVRAKAVLLATGGGPTMYRYHTPSGDKACDGMAMALRAGLTLRDMEMVQFHPTGLLAGKGTRLTGTVLEEGLRGAGGHLLNRAGERFMHKYDDRGERATRDIVSRSIEREIRAGEGTESGGVFIKMSHLGPDDVRKKFPGMVRRCADVGFDLAGGQVEVVPTAHYMMGGVEMDVNCFTSLPGLFVAGEDAGGVHGGNRLGGNGVANSTVYGGVAGEEMAKWVATEKSLPEEDSETAASAAETCLAPFRKASRDLTDLRENLQDMMWDDVGILRNANGLNRAMAALDEFDRQLEETGLGDQSLAFNLTWHDWLNLKNQILVSRSIAAAALARENSRGAHYREDFPDAGALEETAYTQVSMEGDALSAATVPVEFSRVKPGESLIAE